MSQVHGSEVEVVEPKVGPFGGTGHVVRDPDIALADARESLHSHLMAFAAGQARLEGTIVEMGTFRQQAETLTGE